MTTPHLDQGSGLAPADPTGDDWVSLTVADLGVSLRAPRGWEIEPVDAHAVRLFSDVEPAAGSQQHRTTLSIEEGYPEEPGHAWFDWFAVAVIEPLEKEVPGFELIGSDRFRLSSLPADVHLVHFRRDGGEVVGDVGVGPTSQMMAWVWAGNDRMYVVSGAAARDREQTDLPVLEAALRSLRLLPPRPAWLPGPST